MKTEVEVLYEDWKNYFSEPNESVFEMLVDRAEKIKKSTNTTPVLSYNWWKSVGLDGVVSSIGLP